MAAGVFVARWTLPMMLKGTRHIWLDFREKLHQAQRVGMAGSRYGHWGFLSGWHSPRNVAIDVSIPWMIILSAATLLLLVICGGMLWKRTRFS